MLTKKQRLFAQEMRKGGTQTEAAINAGYAENAARITASRLMKNPEIIAEIKRLDSVEQVSKCQGGLNKKRLKEHIDDPKDFLMSVMNDELEEKKMRFEAAKHLMPYFHAKIKSEDLGNRAVRINKMSKSEERKAAAQSVMESGLFTPSVLPSKTVQ